MKGILGLVKTTIVGGFFVVLPVVLILLVVTEIITMLDAMVQPIAEMLPVEELGGRDIAWWIAVFLILLVGFVMGAIARTNIGRRIGGWFEDAIFSRIPPYSLIKSFTKRISGSDADERFAPALLKTGNGMDELAMIVEEHPNGDYTVFIPIAPTLGVGTVFVAAGDRVSKLDVPLGKFIDSISMLGTGLAKYRPTESGPTGAAG
jgi:uncharacterized membrane protein